MGQLHERTGRRIRIVGDLAVVALEDLRPIAQRTVAHAQRLLAARQEVADELVDGPDPRRDDLLHTAWDRAIHRVEQLTFSGVDDGDDEWIGPPVAEGQEIE